MGLGGFFGGETDTGPDRGATASTGETFGGDTAGTTGSGVSAGGAGVSSGFVAGDAEALGASQGGPSQGDISVAEVARNFISFLINPLSILTTVVREGLENDPRSFEQQEQDRLGIEAASEAAFGGAGGPATPPSINLQPTGQIIGGDEPAAEPELVLPEAQAPAATPSFVPTIQQPNIETPEVITATQRATELRRRRAAAQSTINTTPQGLPDLGTIATSPSGLPDIANTLSLRTLPNLRRRRLTGN